MRPTRIDTFALALLLAGLVLPASAGGPKPLKTYQSATTNDALPVLAEGEALLAFALDAESGVESVKLQAVDDDGDKLGKALTIKLEPTKGYSVCVFRVRAAKYKLEMVKAEGAYGGKVTMNLKDPFAIDPGALNYIGDIKLKRHELHVDVTIDNRVGRFSGKLLESRRAIAEGFKLRYAGKDDDDEWSKTIFEGE